MICILMLLSVMTVSGQTHPFIHYNVARGLPARHVTDITADHRGFVWVALGTAGIVRFDGRGFHRLVLDDAGPRDSVLALATDGGRWLFAGGTRGVRAVLLDGHAADRVDSVIDRRLRTIRATVRGLRARRDRTLYIETAEGSWIFSLRDSSLARARREDAPHAFLRTRLPGRTIRKMARDCAGDYWLATDSGLVRLGDTGQDAYGIENGLPAHNLRTVCLDREGGVWCGGEDGLFHFTPRRFQSLTIGDGATVTCMLETLDRELYFGTRGQGLFRFLGGRRAFLTTRDGLPSNSITALRELSTGDILIATDAGVVIWNGNRVQPMPPELTLPDPYVTQVLLAMDRSYWFATHGGLVRWNNERSTVFRVNDGLPSERILCLAEDAYGTILAGTDHGLARVRATGGGSVQSVEELRGQTVTALFFDRDSRMWIGTQGGGVFVLHEGKPRQLGTAEGLAGVNVSWIAQDNHETMYFGCNGGVSVLPRHQMQFLFAVDSAKTYGADAPPARQSALRFTAMSTLTDAMGLRTGALHAGAALRDRFGRLWFSGADGLSIHTPMPPAAVGRWNPPGCGRNSDDAVSLLAVILAGISIDGRDVPPTETVELGSGDHVLRVRLLLPSFRNPGQCRFLYRLEGLETAWHESSDGHIMYSGLKSGRYRLVVQATIGEGIWTVRQSVFDVDIAAPIGQRMLLWALVAAASLGLGLLLRRIRASRMQGRARNATVSSSEEAR